MWKKEKQHSKLVIEHNRYVVEEGPSFFFSNQVEGGDDGDEEMDE
jgi:hypothetical protein